MFYFFFNKEIHTFIQQGLNKLIKSDSKDIYNVVQYLYYKQMFFYSSKIHGKKWMKWYKTYNKW